VIYQPQSGKTLQTRARDLRPGTAHRPFIACRSRGRANVRRFHSAGDIAVMRRRAKLCKVLGREPLSNFRKRHPQDCGNPRCGLCHSDKYPRREPTRQERAARLGQQGDCAYIRGRFVAATFGPLGIYGISAETVNRGDCANPLGFAKGRGSALSDLRSPDTNPQLQFDQSTAPTIQVAGRSRL
jgi:hypothetical protein